MRPGVEEKSLHIKLAILSAVTAAGIILGAIMLAMESSLFLTCQMRKVAINATTFLKDHILLVLVVHAKLA